MMRSMGKCCPGYFCTDLIFYFFGVLNSDYMQVSTVLGSVVLVKTH